MICTADWVNSGGIFDVPRLKEEFNQIEMRSQEPHFWDNPEAAQALMKERTHLLNQIESIEKEESTLEDALVMIEMAEEEGEPSLLEETQTLLAATEKRIQQMETARMLSGEHDRGDAIVTINAGAGGTESQDWASMLFRMIVRFCERKGFDTSITEYHDGEEAGLKGATIEATGLYAYGLLRAESGVHRLVRISPFDSSKRRHTSFASIFVYPLIDDSIEVEIDEKDLKVDTFRASGAGGQHVNKTDSAIRITHIPTGVVVSCQNERSQHKNRATAMKILRSRLYELEMRAREEAMDEVHASKRAIDFGSQIRSYVLHPYRMVKDHRTNFEVSNPDAVLDGDLDDFITTYLLASAGGGADAAR